MFHETAGDDNYNWNYSDCCVGFSGVVCDVCAFRERTGVSVSADGEC